MCFEYQRLKFQWKNGSKFSHLLTGRAEGANLTTSLTVILTAKTKDDIKEMTNWHLTKLMTKEVTDPCSPQLLVWSLVGPVHSRNEYIFSVEFVFQIANTDNLTAINRTEMPNHLILSKMSFFEDLISSICFVLGWQGNFSTHFHPKPNAALTKDGTMPATSTASAIKCSSPVLIAGPQEKDANTRQRQQLKHQLSWKSKTKESSMLSTVKSY